MSDCEKWLANIFAGQVFTNCEKIRTQAESKGFSKKQLNAARKTLGTVTVNDSALHDGKAENWFWLIPREVNKDA